MEGFTITRFNIVEELEKFRAGIKTRAGVETLLHLTACRYLEDTEAHGSGLTGFAGRNEAAWVM